MNTLAERLLSKDLSHDMEVADQRQLLDDVSSAVASQALALAHSSSRAV